MARVTPHVVHVFYNKLRGREARDTFPTVYRCNTASAVEDYACKAGFRVVDIQMWEGRPEYLRIVAPLYAFGYLYERVVNASPSFARFRAVMVFALQKQRD
jgi:hypothetical protein